MRQYLQAVSTTKDLSEDDLETVTGGAKGLAPGFKFTKIESNPPGFWFLVNPSNQEGNRKGQGSLILANGFPN
ncbi:MAG: hypothetical protein NPIRA05_03910 [Nitrospirales bacterium]|nr:MAG: hypothetical protein NPIRA05_03910 [Nitrospirales bacterium]